MAGTDTQKQLLTLIRDFSTEKFQGERRILNQKKIIDELRSELEAANLELEEAKRGKESAEQGIKGYEVELSMNEASIQILETRIALTNNEISKYGSEFAVLKSEENSSRDGFIEKMLELNLQIRKFHKSLGSTSDADNRCEETLNGGTFKRQDHDTQKAREIQENKLVTKIIMQTNTEEHQHEAEKVIHDQVQQDLNNLKKKAFLIDFVMKESMALQELSRSELEEKCAALSSELQKRFLCPRCHQDNSVELGGDSQMSDSNLISC